MNLFPSHLFEFDRSSSGVAKNNKLQKGDIYSKAFGSYYNHVHAFGTAIRKAHPTYSTGQELVTTNNGQSK
jgi:hypothetical protein